uniref:Tudor domain-containing protein n=1 Tax=Steinernema glaseri TaxID=37863 RepID=A0A1I8A6N2_9BILA
MKLLFKIAAKKILVQELPIYADSLPKTVLINCQRYAKMLVFYDYCSSIPIPPLPTVPEECFVFYENVDINFPRTFDRAEKVMDPVAIFMYYVELGNLEGVRRLWSRLDDHQKVRIYNCNDEVVIFLADYFETGVALPGNSLVSIHGKAKFKNFNTCAFIFKLYPVPTRGFILICEFCIALEHEDDSWEANCEQLAGLVALKDFQVEIDDRGVTDLETTIRSNYSKYLRLPKNCRIPEVDEFARERIGPYEPCDVPDSDYPDVAW